MSDLEKTLGRVLGIGVVLSTLALVAGLVAVVFDATISTRLLTTGVVILIATPVARVLISAIAYIRRRDWMFAVLTLIVLGELVASIVTVASGR